LCAAQKINPPGRAAGGFNRQATPEKHCSTGAGFAMPDCVDLCLHDLCNNCSVVTKKIASPVWGIGGPKR
jgi:hypothetical protein